MSAKVAKPVARCFAACTKHNLDARATLSEKEGEASGVLIIYHSVHERLIIEIYIKVRR